MSYHENEYSYENYRDPTEDFLDFLAKKFYFVQDVANHRISKDRLISEYRESQGLAPIWDENHDENDICLCGHWYYRHFDSYENMRPIGCKYCDCYIFKSANIDPEYAEKCYQEKRCPFPNCETPPDTFCLPVCDNCEGHYA